MFEQALTNFRAALRPQPPPQSDVGRLAVAGIVTALLAGIGLMYFADPSRGRGRRAQTIDRLGGVIRRTGRRSRQVGWRVAAEAYGVRQQLRHIGPDANPPDDDLTLKDKVESILFRDPGIEKGSINIHAENGVVVLKGTARTPDEINEIEKRVRAIDGVAGVRNLLHPPNMPAPEWAGAVLNQG